MLFEPEGDLTERKLVIADADHKGDCLSFFRLEVTTIDPEKLVSASPRCPFVPICKRVIHAEGVKKGRGFDKDCRIQVPAPISCSGSFDGRVEKGKVPDRGDGARPFYDYLVNFVDFVNA